MKKIFFICFYSVYLMSNGQIAETFGHEIIINNIPFRIKSITIDQNALYRLKRPSILSEDAFKEIKKRGFNTIKIRLNHVDFEGTGTTIDPNSWNWIDEYLSRASNYNLKVILSMYVAPGGHQSLNKNEEFWLNPSYQDRFRKIWAGISRQFNNDESVIAYELLDNPSPKYSIGQWRQVATTITKQMRKGGDSHIIIIQNCSFPTNSNAERDEENLNFTFLEDEENIIYSFNYWNSEEYTWQRVKTRSFNNEEKYPDESKYVFPADLETFYSTDDNTRIGTGTTEFAYIEGKKYRVIDSSVTSIMPVIYSDNLMPGFAFYNTILIKEYSPNGRYLRDVMLADPNKLEGWEIKTKDKRAKFSLIPDYGTSPFSVIRIDRVSTPTKVYNTTMRFVPKFGFYYSIGAHCLTKSINVEGESYLRFDFERSSSNQKATVRNKEGIVIQLSNFVKWAKDKNVPLLLSGFGASKSTFKGNKGGENYIEDVFTVIEKNKLNFSYDSLDNEDFGLYTMKKNGVLKATKNTFSPL